MEDGSRQPSMGRNSVGYRPLVPDALAKASGSAVYAYVTAAAGFGLLFGVGIAVTAGYGHFAAAPKALKSVPSIAAGLKTLPAAYTGPAPSLLSQVDPQKKSSAASPLSPPNGKSTENTAGAPKKHGIQKLWPFSKGAGESKTAKRRPYVSPNPPADVNAPTALQMASAAESAGPFVLVIQGEATIAGYDDGTGTVETYEGQTFVLDKTAVETSAIRWPDFPFHVHYRCDEAGSCTLMRGGATASAKLAR